MNLLIDYANFKFIVSLITIALGLLSALCFNVTFNNPPKNKILCSIIDWTGVAAAIAFMLLTVYIGCFI